VPLAPLRGQQRKASDPAPAPASGGAAAPRAGAGTAAGADDARHAPDQVCHTSGACTTPPSLLQGGRLRVPGAASSSSSAAAATGRPPIQGAPLACCGAAAPQRALPPSDHPEAAVAPAEGVASEERGGGGEGGAPPLSEHASKHTRELLRRQLGLPEAERARLAELARERGNEAFRWGGARVQTVAAIWDRKEGGDRMQLRDLRKRL
jgi:hypothetical protein